MNINYENKLFNGEIVNTVTPSVIPINYDLYKFPDRLSGKLNEFRQRIDMVKMDMYNQAVGLDRSIVQWNSNYKAIESMLESAETSVNDRLFLRSDTDGFYNTMFENFTVSDYVDFDNSYQVLPDINLHQVTLDHDLDDINTIALNDTAVYSLTVSKGPNSGPERVMTIAGSNLNNLIQDNLSGWTGSVTTKTRRPISLIFEINFRVAQDVASINLGIIDPSRAIFISASCVDESDMASILLENASVSNANVIPVFRKVKKVQILITKTNYDERNSSSNEYKYIFHLTHLKVFAQIPGYKREGIFYSKPFLVSGNKKFAIETCDFIPANTNIEYYLSIENFTNGDSHSAVGGTGTQAKVKVNFPSILSEGTNLGPYTSSIVTMPEENSSIGYQVNDELVVLGSDLGGYTPGNNLRFKVATVNGSGKILSIKNIEGNYVFGHLNVINPINKPPSSNAPYGLYIDNIVTTNNINYAWPYISDAAYKILPFSANSSEIYNFVQSYKFVNQTLAISPDKNNNNIGIYANHSMLSDEKQDIWELKGSYYQTWIYNEKDENSILDVGDSGIIIEGLPLTNGSYRLNKSGWFKVKVPMNKYFDVGSTFNDLETLKNLDPIFPYNGKYLIEGTSLKIAPYLGFKNRAKKKLYLANNLSSLNNDSFYLMRIPGNDTNMNMFLAVVSGDTDIKNAYIEYDQEIKSNFYNLRLIAKMKTNNVSITPILSSYKIKLGV